MTLLKFINSIIKSKLQLAVSYMDDKSNKIILRFTSKPRILTKLKVNVQLTYLIPTDKPLNRRVRILFS